MPESAANIRCGEPIQSRVDNGMNLHSSVLSPVVDRRSTVVVARVVNHDSGCRAQLLNDEELHDGTPLGGDR